MLLRTLAPLALGLLLAPGAVAVTYQVQQTGAAFDPDEITIAVGDTVEWVHSAGNHTVTEGTDDDNPPIGSKLFDAPLDMFNPTFSFTFTEAGDVDFYCRPHRTLGMTGVIHVEQPTAAPEVTSLAFSRLKNLYR